MRSVLFVLSLVMMSNAQAQVGKIANCFADADADWIRVGLYRINHTLYAEVSQVTGDGDEYSSDVIQVIEVATTNPSVRVFTQAVDQVATPTGFLDKASHKMRGTVIQIPRVKGEGSIIAKRGPFGDREFKNYTPLFCVNSAKDIE